MNKFVKPVDTQPEKGKVVEWLQMQMSEKCPFLLAFADDGIIWRVWVKGEIKSPSAVSDLPKMPEFREKTLQQAHVFGSKSEVRVFRDEMFTDENAKWKALRLVDGDDPKLVIKESQVLWGNEAKGPAKDGFIYASEYRAGIPGQWLPLEETFGPNKCARLEVHHLVEVDPDTGEARIAASRLAGLSVGERAMEVKS